MTQQHDLLINAVTTLVTTLLVKYFCFDNMLYGPVHTIALLIVGFSVTTAFNGTLNDIFFNFSLIHLAIFFLICFVSFCVYKYITEIKILFTRYEQIVVYDHKKIKLFYDYTKFYPNFYIPCNKVCVGHPDTIGTSQYEPERVCGGDFIDLMERPDSDEKIYFTDTNFNVYGYYLVSIKSVDVTTVNVVRTESGRNQNATDIKYFVPSITIHIYKNKKITAGEYFNKLLLLCEEKLVDEKKLFHQKLYFTGGKRDFNCDEICFYDPKNVKKDDIIDGKTFIDTFFHTDKNDIMDIINTVHFNPNDFYKMGQIPKAGLLLHGPPGTGKSNFAYRIARYLNRHLISLDIKSLRKTIIYQNIKKPYVNDKPCKPNEVIFFFDEFDETVIELYKRQKIKQSYYENIKEVGLLNTNNITNIISQDTGHTNQNKNQIDTIALLTAMNMRYDKYDKNDKNKDEPHDDANVMTINDLLELFQGAVPLDGIIFIATTNKYEELMKICPALVRHGRLTPILFDNFNGILLNEVSTKFFSKEIPSEIISNAKQSRITVTNSQVMEWAMQFKKLDNGFNLFINKIKEHLSTN
ncbi:MAG: AAA family ATPase [Terrestrivirus sp.]|uniref:AAA family ATPase n=1 Tax=Terrestrivirus sp. TaxID=2487775 RepID=A0A3G4ZN23_9VIRU|nr:MAG: AAA family ATPase [Terrestrivirus sp.]